MLADKTFCFSYFFFCRGYWKTWLDRLVQTLLWKLSRAFSTSWLPACWRASGGHSFVRASSPHATGEGCPLPKQPGQDHLYAPGTCPKKVELKLDFQIDLFTYLFEMNDCKFQLMWMFVLFVMLSDFFPTSVHLFRILWSKKCLEINLFFM